jgi:zinc protease
MLLRLSSVLIAVLLLAALPAPAKAIGIKAVTSPGGITAWLVEDHTIPLISMSFSFRGGASADPDGKTGLTQFLSGMLDEGAGSLDSAAFQARVDELSMKLSFEAGRDQFIGSLQTLSAVRDQSFALLKLALTAPRFDPEPLERIRNQLLVNLREHEEDPEEVAALAWMRTALGRHPYGRPTNGTEAALNAVTAEDLRGLSHRIFARDSLLIAVVGDVDADTLARLLDETFGSLPAASRMPAVPEATPPAGPIVEVIERDIPQSIICFGQEGIKRSDPAYMAAHVMNTILGDDTAGARLADELREKRGLTYSVYSELRTLERAGIFYGCAATVNERAAEAIGILRQELKRMAEDGPTEQELADAKAYLTGSYALDLESSSDIAYRLLVIQRHQLGIDYMDRYDELIQAVTLDEVKRVAHRLIKPDKLVFTVVGKPQGVKPTLRTGG